LNISNAPLIFDGHNDVLYRLLMDGGMAALDSFSRGRDGHIDLPRAKKGGFAGGFFALFAPSDDLDEGSFEAMLAPAYDLPLPAPVAHSRALAVIMEKAAMLLALERRGALTICTDTAQMRRCFETGRMAAIMHIEGAEAIDAELNALEVLHAAGLRSLGPVWSRPTIFGHGVPFRFPSTPDTGPGLTDAGKRLVRRCNALGIMLDLSHLNEAGFWDVARISDAPLVATHSNAHAICPHARNLTDAQLDAIAESDGMVGLNFAAAFLREDGQMNPDVPLETLLRHLDHLIGRLGEDRVGFGSDFDGAVVPADIGDVAGLPALGKAMAAHGYDDKLLKKLGHENWLRVLERTWGQGA